MATEIGETNSRGFTWDGTRWQKPGTPVAGGGKGGGPGGVVPRPAAPPPTGPGLTRNDVLKEVLGGVGMVGGGMLTGGMAPALVEAAPLLKEIPFFANLLRVGGAASGGASGRMVGHVPEALVERTTGTPSGSTFGEEATRGAIEGTVGETLPLVVPPVARATGRGLAATGRGMGRLVGDVPGASEAQRWISRLLRGGAAHMFGYGPVGDVIASSAPQIVEGTGRGLEAAGRTADAPWLGGPGSLSERVESGLDWLKGRVSGTPRLGVPERYTPNVSGYRPGAPASNVAVGVQHAPATDPYAPNVSGYTGPSSSDLAVGVRHDPLSGAVVEPHMPNVSGAGGPGSRGTTRFEGAQEFQPSVNRYTPNVSGYHPSAPASDVAVGGTLPNVIIDRYAPNISGFDPLAPASDVAVGEPYQSPATEILTQRSGAPRGVARPQTPVENLVANLDPQPAAVTPELVDASRMPEALLTAEEKAARDAKSMARTHQLADAGMKGADYAKAKFGTDFWPNLTDAQRAEVAAYERSLTGGVDVEAAQIDQMVNATTREKFGRAYEDLQPHEQRSVDVLRSRLSGTDAPVTPTQKLAAAPEPQLAAAPPADEGWITPAETLRSVGAPAPTGGRGFWSGLRRGDLWPQLQEELLSTAEGPAAPKPRGRTGEGIRDARGRLKKK